MDQHKECEKSSKVFESQAIETKNFVQDNFKINYCNTSSIYASQNASPSSIKVNNYLCYQEGNTLFKVTEIIYENKIIRIEDRFGIDSTSGILGPSDRDGQEKTQIGYKKNSRNIQKVRLFCQNLKTVQTSTKKDKKNVVKNIIKIFVSWLDKQGGSKPEKQVNKELGKIIRNQNYNNRLIKKVCTSKQLNKCFLQFLEHDVAQEIQYSRIHDKQAHYEAIEIYKQIIKSSIKKEDQNLGINQSFSCLEASSDSQFINTQKPQTTNNESLATNQTHNISADVNVEMGHRKNKIILISKGFNEEQ